MSIEDIQAVIESARARERGHLEEFIRGRMPGASDEQVREAAETAVEIIEAIPVFLARADQEARRRKLTRTVQPVLGRAERYFLQPVDLIPEMTQGLVGLLDDSYLVLRILEHLDRGPEPFLDWDLRVPLLFLRRLVGEEVARRLDSISVAVVEEVAAHLQEVWKHLAHEA